MENLRPNERRAKNATILIWIVLIMEIAAFVSHFFQYILLQSAANGEAISMEYATSNDLRERIIAIIYLIVFLVSAFTFIQWFRRAYFNLHLRVNYLSHSEGWAAALPARFRAGPVQRWSRSLRSCSEWSPYRFP